MTEHEVWGCPKEKIVWTNNLFHQTKESPLGVNEALRRLRHTLWFLLDLQSRFLQNCHQMTEGCNFYKTSRTTVLHPSEMAFLDALPSLDHTWVTLFWLAHLPGFHPCLICSSSSMQCANIVESITEDMSTNYHENPRQCNLHNNSSHTIQSWPVLETSMQTKICASRVFSSLITIKHNGSDQAVWTEQVDCPAIPFVLVCKQKSKTQIS